MIGALDAFCAEIQSRFTRHQNYNRVSAKSLNADGGFDEIVDLFSLLHVDHLTGSGDEMGAERGRQAVWVN